MSIQGMREWVRTHRVMLGIIIVLLIAGLLITFASMGLAGRNQVANETDSTAAFETAIEKQREDLAANPTDYSANYSLANTLYEYAAQIVGTDTEASFAAFEEAAGLYLVALENAPEDLNDVGIANMYVKVANCYSVIGQNDEAEKYYDMAVEAAPADLDTSATYVQHLVSISKYDEAIKVMEALINATDDESVISAANNMIEQIKAAQESAANAETENTEDTTEENTEE